MFTRLSLARFSLPNQKANAMKITENIKTLTTLPAQMKLMTGVSVVAIAIALIALGVAIGAASNAN